MKNLQRFTGLILMLTFCMFLSAQEKQIVIFSTNDMHARINNYGKIAAYIENYKKTNPNVLILSAGDLFSGNPVVDQYKEKGYPIVDLMNRIGYKYTAFGNHEFDYGQETLKKRIKQAKFKFLCANMQVEKPEGKIRQPKAYAFTKVGGIKIGIVSVVEASIKPSGKRHPACHPDRVKGINFTDPVETVLQYKYLRDKCDLFIFLSHAGVDKDLIVAERMPEIDAIVGGHTHTKIDSVLIHNGVLVTQTGCYTEGLGKLTFTFDGKQLVKKDYELIDVRSLKEESQDIKQEAQAFVDNSPLKEVLAEAVQQLDGKEELGGLMCDALVEEYGVDFAVQNSGGVRLGQLKQGPITMQDVYALDPFGNQIFIYEMTYQALNELLKNSYRKSSKTADLKCSGMKYKIYTHDGLATRVEITNEQGNPLDQNKKYKVAMNSYISSSYRFDHNGLIEETPNSASDALISYLKRVKQIKKDIHRTEVIEE